MRELRTALVLGGAGFLGSWLVETLRSEGVQAIVVDDLRTGHATQVNGAELIIADVSQADLAGIITERAVDVVFHLANAAYVPPSLEWPFDDLKTNVGTTLALLEGVRRLPRSPLVIYASSAAVYGQGQMMPMAETHPIEPISPYGVSKFAAEQYVRLYASLYRIPSLSVRIFSLYGPRQRKQVVYDLMSRLLAGEDPLPVIGAPTVSRDLVFIKDAARAFLALARRAPANGEVYNLASGKSTSLAELTQTLIEATGRQVRVRFSGKVRPGDTVHWRGDPSKARELGVDCPTPLLDGLTRTAQWLLGIRDQELATAGPERRR